MEELKIIYLSPDELTPYENNTRKHSSDDIESIKKSILDTGFNDPIGIWGDQNLIVEGHGWQIAAKELHLDKVPCIRLDHLTDEQRREYAIRHNRSAELSAWDFEALEEELARLNLDGIDMDDLNFVFSDEEEEEAPIQTTEDEAPEVKEEANTVLGDVYQLGDHILICGDCTEESTFKRLMGEDRAKILFTSPPYSDMREYNGGKDLSVEHLAEFIRCCRPYTDYQCVNLGIQRKNNEIFQYWDTYIQKARDSGYKLMAWNVWDKGMTGNIGQAKAFFHLRHEFIFVFGTEFFEINLTMEKKPESITDHPSRHTKRNADGTTEEHTTGDTSKKYKQMESVLFMHPVLQNSLRDLHPASFPVGLPAEYIKAMTAEGDIVIEPFGGSGTTLIACEQLKRKCRIVELDPHYCDVIVQRWEEFTGQKAVLLNGGD